MPNKAEQEIVYYLKPLDATRCAIAKEIDGHVNEEQVYVIEGNDCNCPGAVYHRTQCKHLRMHKQWVALGRKPMTAKPIGKDTYAFELIAQEQP